MKIPKLTAAAIGRSRVAHHSRARRGGSGSLGKWGSTVGFIDGSPNHRVSGLAQPRKQARLGGPPESQARVDKLGILTYLLGKLGAAPPPWLHAYRSESPQTPRPSARETSLTMTVGPTTTRDDAKVADLHEQLAEKMEERGLRSTSQRRLVCDLFFRSRGHHSVDDLLALVHKRDPKVGYATVYRTLKLLVECGLANERHFSDSLTRFEVTDTDHHHDHLICIDCNEIIEFEDDEIERLQDQLAARYGYVLVRHKHELYGRCRNCRERS